MIDIQKIRDHWKPEEKHELLLIDCAISDIYTLCDELDKHRWIPVSERLPERENNKHCASSQVLCSTGNHSFVGRYDHKYKRWSLQLDGNIKLHGVTHWMPIILPKEGE